MKISIAAVAASPALFASAVVLVEAIEWYGPALPIFEPLDPSGGFGGGQLRFYRRGSFLITEPSREPVVFGPVLDRPLRTEPLGSSW